MNSTLSDLSLINATIDASDFLLKVYDIFERNNSVPGIIVVKEGEFFALLSRKHFFEIMSKQFMYDLFSKRKVDFFFAADYVDIYLILPSSTSIISAANLALQRMENKISEPIIVQFENNEFKILDFYELLLAQNIIQHQMNNLLQEANDFKQEVLAIVAHDLRNPIGAILGFSDLIKEPDCNIEKSKEYAGYINKTAGQMEDLVNNFLVSSINNSIEFDLVLTWFDINELLTSVINNFNFTIFRKNQSLKYEFDPCDYSTLCDKIHLKEVFENLISNAIKYSNEDKEIYVRLSKTDSHFIFIVKDQGPGFSVKDQEKIYGKFQRLSARPTANESSTGLGLFITKKIIDKLKGKISLVSNLAEGSTFTIVIPLLSEYGTDHYLKSKFYDNEKVKSS